MTRWALVRESDGGITNLIVLENLKDYNVPEGFALIEDNGEAQMGGKWENSRFHPAPVEVLPEIPPSLEARVAAIEAELRAINSR